MPLTVTAEPPVFLYVAVALSVWPAITTVLSSVSGVTMLRAPEVGVFVTVKSTVLEVPPPGAGLTTLM